MRDPVIAIYPGTFDPITLGHEDIVRRASRLFDEVVVAVAMAHHKKTLFDLQARCDLVESALQDCPNVRVLPFDGLVVEFARQHRASVMVRGVRSVMDYEYEFQLAGMNRRLQPTIDTVFFNTAADQQCVSSTLVREIATLKGDVSSFVSPGVLQQLQARLA
jgi:pantetheine-phosphate adenylyltransferase